MHVSESYRSNYKNIEKKTKKRNEKIRSKYINRNIVIKVPLFEGSSMFSPLDIVTLIFAIASS